MTASWGNWCLMNRNHDYSLENFLCSFLNRAGAVVEKPSYGLAEVLLPDELAKALGKEELTLAFDYEVAAETPESTFVAPGSPLLDTAVRLASSYGRYTRHYWPGSEPGYPKNLEQKINKTVDYLQCRAPRIAGHHIAENVYYIFYFLAVFRSFEKTEEIFPVAINGHTGLPYPPFEEYWQKIIPRETPLYRLGRAELYPVRDLYGAACREVEQQVRKRSLFLRDNAARLLQRELEKTGRYYQETISELQQKIAESNEPSKKERLQNQLEAARVDWQRRQDDIASRYNLEVELKLDHLVACCVPCLFVKVEIQHKNIFNRQTLVYNPLTGEVEIPPCSLCGKPSRVLKPNESGQLVCPEH